MGVSVASLMMNGVRVPGVVIEGNCSTKNRTMIAFETMDGRRVHGCGGFSLWPRIVGREVAVLYSPADPPGSHAIPGWRMRLPFGIFLAMGAALTPPLYSIAKQMRKKSEPVSLTESAGKGEERTRDAVVEEMSPQLPRHEKADTPPNLAAASRALSSDKSGRPSRDASSR